MKIFEFLEALRPTTGLSQARLREKEIEKRMRKLLKQDLETFKRGLAELGLNENDEEYKRALKVYDETP